MKTMVQEQKLLEQILILRSQIGDRDALAELMGIYEKSLRYFISHLINDSQIVEDISQQTWLRVIKKICTLKEPTCFASWIYSIARNNCYEELKKQKLLLPLDDNLELHENPPDDNFHYDDAVKLHHCLKKLRPEHKEVLLLRFLEQMSYEEISRVTGCNIGTVRSRIFYAKQTLKKEMEKEISYDK
jgi:RNA polymerase sigma-70 factor, ECF subfamily